MEFNKSYDEKIMSYKGDNWEEFVALFTDEELEQIRQERCIYYSYLYTGDKESLLMAYLEEWAVEQVRDRIVSGTEQLLRLLYAFAD